MLFYSEDDLLSVFEGVPQFDISRSTFESGINVIDFLADHTKVFPSRGEARKMLQGGGVFINKEKIIETELIISMDHVIREKYILAQKGKKNYYLIIIN